jgi:ribosomal protein S4
VRLIRQNAVTVNGEKVSDPNMSITSGATIKVGKRRYIKTV